MASHEPPRSSRATHVLSRDPLTLPVSSQPIPPARKTPNTLPQRPSPTSPPAPNAPAIDDDREPCAPRSATPAVDGRSWVRHSRHSPTPPPPHAQTSIPARSRRLWVAAFTSKAPTSFWFRYSGSGAATCTPGGSAIGVKASQRAEAVLVARAVVTWHQRATLTRATHLPAMLGHGDTTDGRAYTIEGSSTELGYFLCNIPADENVSAATAKIPRAHVVAAPGCQNSSLVVRLPQGRHGAHPQPAHRITDLTIACRARNNGTSPRARSPY